MPRSPASLRLLPAGLALAMDRCNVVQLRRGATRAACLAIASVGLADPSLDAALAALQSGRTGDGPARDALLRLVGELDEAAWAVQDRVDAPAHGAYVLAFKRARSANALYAALDADPMVAAADAAYESHAVIEDWEPLIELWA